MTAPVTLHRGDCLDVLATLPAESFDAIVTDPPYHLTSIVKRFGSATAAAAKPGADGAFARGSRNFIGQTWDGGDVAFRAETWAALARVLKPGGHVVAFNHSRTFHRMAVAIEDAGLEMREAVFDLYSTGIAWADFLASLSADQLKALARAMAGGSSPLLAWLYATGHARTHKGDALVAVALGTDRADPEAAAWADWATALKPAIEPIVLARKPLAETSIARQMLATGTGALNVGACRAPAPDLDGASRYPANVVTDGSPDVLATFPASGGATAGRFFFSAKASAEDRGGSDHPTVKPQALMRWLVRLVSAPGGLILDPFGGSGSTGWAAAAEGRRCVLIERDPRHGDHIAARIASAFAPAVAGQPSTL